MIVGILDGLNNHVLVNGGDLPGDALHTNSIAVGDLNYDRYLDIPLAGNLGRANFTTEYLSCYVLQKSLSWY